MKPTLFQQRKGYYIHNNQITFIFAKNIYNQQLNSKQIKEVAVEGSFTEWKDYWPLTKINSSLWQLTRKLKAVKVPGISGQPEFRFIINGEKNLNAVANLSLKYKLYDEHRGGYKNIILLPEDNPAKIQQINIQTNSYKTDYASQQELANFRSVPTKQGTSSSLYRSYHPFIKSKPNHPLEEKRLKTVQKLIKKHNINSIINLADKQTEIPNLLTKYQQFIADRQNIIFINQSHNYDIYYYSTQNQEFKELLQKVISFIINHQPPFLVHCRIGTDRTGVVAAILAALMGSPWAKIVSDYQQSNKTGIKEYRDKELLRYTFKQLLNRPSIPKDLEQAVTSYFKTKLQLTNQEIKTLQQKLS